MHPFRPMTRRQLLLTAVVAPLAAALAPAALAPAVGWPTRVARAMTLPSYRIEAEVNLDDGTVSASQVLTMRNNVGVALLSVVFRVVPASVGTFTLLGATVDGRAAEGRLVGSALEIPLEAAIQPGATVELGLRYTMRLPREPDRLAAAGRTVALGNWFPILAVHRGDWDRRQYVDVGDAFFSEVANYDVTMTTSRAAEVAATGQLVNRDGTRWRFRAASVRDFALAISPDYVVHESRMGETTVRAYAFSAARAGLLADRAAVFLRWLSDRLGPYPYPSLAIADVELSPSYGGMEYPALVMLSPNIPVGQALAGGNLDTLLLHEIVHQWFYSIVGNDEIADPWLDEALTTYVTYLYYADAEPGLGQGVFDRTIPGDASGPVDSAVTEFPSDPPYFGVVYRRGARFLHALRARLGDAPFMALLRDYVATHRDRIATPRAFLDQAQAAAGQDDVGPLIRDYFRYGAFAYSRPQSWTVEAPPSPWSGSASVFVGADFAVSRVELWLDQYRLAAGPENAVTLDLSGVEPGEYVLLARAFNHEDVIFERTRRVEIR